MMRSSAVIMPRSPWLPPPRRTLKHGGAGRGKGRSDLAADVAGFPHAGDDEPAGGAVDQLDRGDECRSEAVADVGCKRRDADRLRLERAQRRREPALVV